MKNRFASNRRDAQAVRTSIARYATPEGDAATDRQVALGNLSTAGLTRIQPEFLRHVTAAHKKYTAVPVHGGTARIETKLQGRDNRASASSYCIGENYGPDVCSAHFLSYTLHVCVGLHRAEGINKQRSQNSRSCSRSGFLPS